MRKRGKYQWLLLTPIMLIMILLVIYPIIRTFMFSLYRFKLTEPNDISFIGLQNYAKVFKSHDFYYSLQNSLLILFFVIVLTVVSSLAVGLLLNKKTRLSPLLTAIAIVPWALPPLINGIIWKFIFHPGYGLMNKLLIMAHITDAPISWTTDRIVLMLVVSIVVSWRVVPFCAIIVLANLQNIPGELLARNTHILPTSIYLGNYENLLNPDTSGHDALFTGISNSVYTSVITVLVGLPIATMSGYLFAKYKFKGQNIALKFILFTIVIPVFTTIIPIYSIFSEYGILDNLFWISVIYISAFLPINTWIIFNYFRGLPQDLWDAAFIDGCNEVQTFFWVILPVSYPIIITCALMMFLMSWNQFQIPLILTSSQNNKVVTLILSEFMSRDAISYGAIAACGIFSILPPAVVAIIFRRFLVSGLMSGSVKS